MENESHPTTEAARPNDQVDDLFDYDVGLDGILREINTNSGNTIAPKQTAPLDNSGVVLGLDEEVKVTKKRQSVAKLDENRLLTQAGIPKLRHSSRKNLKFKGKGHEFSDLARLLSFYQLWLDDLFPRAKFADGLAMIERLGHSKRLQTMRRTWIDEEKPNYANDEPSRGSDADDNIADKDTSMTDVPGAIQNNTSGFPGRVDDNGDDLFMPDNLNNERPATDNAAPPDDDLDELDALLREQADEPGIQNTTSTGGKDNDHAPPDDGFDELDALLREQEDALGTEKNVPAKITGKEQTQPDEADFDDLDALLREHENENSEKTKDNRMETDSLADELEAMEGSDMV